jgi:hypothetical protein
MRRARVWLGIACACLLVAIVWLVLVGPPDALASVLRRQRSFSTQYIEQSRAGGDLFVYWAEIPGASGKDTGIYRDLLAQGWRPPPFSSRGHEVVGLDRPGGDAYVRFSGPLNGFVRIAYTRKASSFERGAHAIRKLFGIDDGRP